MRRNALDKRNYRQLVETTVELANKVGFVPVVERIVDDLKDESEPCVFFFFDFDFFVDFFFDFFFC